MRQTAVSSNIMRDQNINELLKKSTPADQDYIYKSVAKQLLTNERQDLTIRKTAKISLDGSEQEIKEKIAGVLGISTNEVDFTSIQKQLEQIKKEYLRTKNIISSYELFLQKSKAPKDKFEELNDIGKYIKKHNPSLVLKIPENADQVPDFILEDGDKLIGIEHTRLINQDTQKIIGTLKKIIFNAQKFLLEKSETSNTLINIGFKYEEKIIKDKNLFDNLSQKEIKQIGSNIAEIIIGFQKSTSHILPDYIDKILVQETKFSTEINLIENYISKNNYDALLTKLIERKESKLKRYRYNNGLEEIWLLIINSGIKSSSGFEMPNQTSIKSNFNKILVMDNFDYSIIELT